MVTVFTVPSRKAIELYRRPHFATIVAKPHNDKYSSPSQLYYISNNYTNFCFIRFQILQALEKEYNIFAYVFSQFNFFSALIFLAVALIKIATPLLMMKDSSQKWSFFNFKYTV